MKSLIVFPLVLALALAEEHFATHQNSHTHLDSHTQPLDSAALEEELVEEGLHHAVHLQGEVPHPHLVHLDQLHPKMTLTDTKKFHEEDIGSQNPVPNPHLVPEATEPRMGAEEGSHLPQGSFEGILHNAVEEQAVYLDEEIPQGTENSLNNFFEHYPNTGFPETEPTAGTESGMEVVQEPVVLPVTEGKNRGQDSSSSVQYSLPKELMPIHPGGGSKFDDLEKEKLEKKKMAQTKGTDEDTENGASHEAEGLYSSAAKLCLSSLIFTLSSSFRLIV